MLWRWHFLAALIVIPFVLWQGTTGVIYLWSEALIDWRHPGLRFVAASTASVPPSAQLAAALATAPKHFHPKSAPVGHGHGAKPASPASGMEHGGPPVQEMLLSSDPRRSTIVMLLDEAGLPYPVFVDPRDARVLGSLTSTQWLPGITRALHGGWPLGKPGSWLLELADGWAIFMIVSGLYLWWPRGRGFLMSLWPRFDRGSRILTRDLHASVAVLFSIVFLFFLVSALPWTAFWGGEILSRIQTSLGQKSPAGFSPGGASVAQMTAAMRPVDEIAAEARARGVSGTLIIRLAPWPGAPLFLMNRDGSPSDDRVLHGDPKTGKITGDFLQVREPVHPAHRRIRHSRAPGRFRAGQSLAEHRLRPLAAVAHRHRRGVMVDPQAAPRPRHPAQGAHAVAAVPDRQCHRDVRPAADLRSFRADRRGHRAAGCRDNGGRRERHPSSAAVNHKQGGSRVMTRSHTRPAMLLSLAMAFCLALSATAPASAHDYKLGSLEITHPWTRATPATAQTGGGFLTITNKGTTPDRLIAARSPASNKVEVHEMKMDGNVMKMRELEKGLEIPAGATVTLKPGGYHIMFMGAQGAARQGYEGAGDAGVREGRQHRHRTEGRGDRRGHLRPQACEGDIMKPDGWFTGSRSSFAALINGGLGMALGALVGGLHGSQLGLAAGIALACAARHRSRLGGLARAARLAAALRRARGRLGRDPRRHVDRRRRWQRPFGPSSRLLQGPVLLVLRFATFVVAGMARPSLALLGRALATPLGIRQPRRSRRDHAGNLARLRVRVACRLRRTSPS